MRNDRLLLFFCLLLFAGGALLVVRGMRHPPAPPPPPPRELSVTAPSGVSASPAAREASPVPTTVPALETPTPLTPAVPSPRPTVAVAVVAAAAKPPAPTAAPPSPIRSISVESFLARPRRLDRHPIEVGRCRVVEHWTTGYCYVFSLSSNRKISQREDARCDDLPELRRRVRALIDNGECR